MGVGESGRLFDGEAVGECLEGDSDVIIRKGEGAKGYLERRQRSCSDRDTRSEDGSRRWKDLACLHWFFAQGSADTGTGAGTGIRSDSECVERFCLVKRKCVDAVATSPYTFEEKGKQ